MLVDLIITLLHPQNKMDEAKMAFQRASDKKSNGKTNIAGQLALAMMHYHTKQYLPALKL
jgi:hypothetical protein